MIKNFRNLFTDIDVSVSAALFEGSKKADHEMHLFLEPGKQHKTPADQLKHVSDALNRFMVLHSFVPMQVVFKRYFLSDAANQWQLVEQAEEAATYAVSVVQQPPLSGAKLAVWVHLVATDEVKKLHNNMFSYNHLGHQHLLACKLLDNASTTHQQTSNIFNHYVSQLESHNLSLKNNCIRTWLFVQNVDVNYAAVVDSRKSLFDAHNMTAQTHYIASTGIEGRSALPQNTVLMDAYAVQGLASGQISFLQASDHLNPTHEYGVTFERGTAVEYSDRRQVFISGTASIDNKGAVVHVGNIEQQIARTIKNIAALLQNTKASFSDVVQMIVYLRDTADYDTVKQYLDNYYQLTPHVIVLAPVCRPTWLIEIECIAIAAK